MALWEHQELAYPLCSLPLGASKAREAIAWQHAALVLQGHHGATVQETMREQQSSKGHLQRQDRVLWRAVQYSCCDGGLQHCARLMAAVVLTVGLLYRNSCRCRRHNSI